MKKDDGLKIAIDLTCPSCEQSIEFIKDLQNAHPTAKGDVVICSTCAFLCKVGDSNLIPLKREEFSKLDDQSKHLIAMMVTSILKKNKRENR